MSIKMLQILHNRSRDGPYYTLFYTADFNKIYTFTQYFCRNTPLSLLYLGELLNSWFYSRYAEMYSFFTDTTDFPLQKNTFIKKFTHKSDKWIVKHTLTFRYTFKVLQSLCANTLNCIINCIVPPDFLIASYFVGISVAVLLH